MNWFDFLTINWTEAGRRVLAYAVITVYMAGIIYLAMQIGLSQAWTAAIAGGAISATIAAIMYLEAHLP